MKADPKLDGETADGNRVLSGPWEAASCWRKPLPLAPYLTLVRSLADLLVPVQPDPDFRRRLHSDLVASGRQLQALRLLEIASPTTQAPPEAGLLPQWLAREWEQPERRWVLGAAALGSAASLVGALAYLVRYRRRSGTSL